MAHQFQTQTRVRALAAAAIIMASGCLLYAPSAAAQGATSNAVTSPTGNPYKPCVDGTTNEDRTTCMKEAGAAKAEARRGQLGTDGTSYDRNAMQRCDALPGNQQEACRLRVKGVGTTSGSVAGGGELHEVVTQNPTPPAAMPAMPMPGNGVK